MYDDQTQNTEDCPTGACMSGFNRRARQSTFSKELQSTGDLHNDVPMEPARFRRLACEPCVVGVRHTERAIVCMERQKPYFATCLSGLGSRAQGLASCLGGLPAIGPVEWRDMEVVFRGVHRWNSSGTIGVSLGYFWGDGGDLTSCVVLEGEVWWHVVGAI